MYVIQSGENKTIEEKKEFVKYLSVPPPERFGVRCANRRHEKTTFKVNEKRRIKAAKWEIDNYPPNAR